MVRYTSYFYINSNLINWHVCSLDSYRDTSRFTNSIRGLDHFVCSILYETSLMSRRLVFLFFVFTWDNTVHRFNRQREFREWNTTISSRMVFGRILQFGAADIE